MTNEQKVRVDRLERYLITDRGKTYTRVRVNDLDTALSLIKEQQEEIERLKTDNGNVWQLNANMSKRHLKDICKLKQKDKQIDLMAFNLADYIMYYEYDKCRNPEMIKNKAEEIKQYFENKVNSSEQN